MTKSSENVRRMVLCAMFTALVAVCSQIAVPMPWGVPINLALFAVYMAGTMLGPVWGTASQVVFIALAAIGVPVLANFSGGIDKFVRPHRRLSDLLPHSWPTSSAWAWSTGCLQGCFSPWRLSWAPWSTISWVLSCS